MAKHIEVDWPDSERQAADIVKVSPLTPASMNQIQKVAKEHVHRIRLAVDRDSTIKWGDELIVRKGHRCNHGQPTTEGRYWSE